MRQGPPHLLNLLHLPENKLSVPLESPEDYELMDGMIYRRLGSNPRDSRYATSV